MNKRMLVFLALAAAAVTASATARKLLQDDPKVAPYGQCGGLSNCPNTRNCGDKKWPDYSCTAGYSCTRNDAYYRQCTPKTPETDKFGPWAQCGGISACPSLGSTDGNCKDAAWNRPYQGCTAGYHCVKQNDYYYQCVPTYNP